EDPLARARDHRMDVLETWTSAWVAASATVGSLPGWGCQQTGMPAPPSREKHWETDDAVQDPVDPKNSAGSIDPTALRAPGPCQPEHGPRAADGPARERHQDQPCVVVSKLEELSESKTTKAEVMY